MVPIYLRYPDGQTTQRSEEEVRSLWENGLIPVKTIYWRTGMAEWKPLSEWLGERVSVVSEVPAQEEDQNRRFLIDPSRLTRFLQRLLWIGAAVAAIAVVLDLVEFFQVRTGRISFDQLEMSDPLQAAVGLLQSMLQVTTGVVFLRWVFRSYKNIQGFGTSGLRFSPGWAVGYYFIPFLSLIRPLQVMSEIWRASENPSDWSKRHSSRLVTVWWILFLTYSIATQISFELALQVSTLDQWSVSAGFAILSDILSIPLSIAVLRLISRVYQNQRRLVDGAELVASV